MSNVFVLIDNKGFFIYNIYIVFLRRLKMLLKSEKIENTARTTVCILMAIISCFLLVVSLFQTTGMEIVSEKQSELSRIVEKPEGNESVIYYSDNFLLNVAVLALCAFVCFALLPRLSAIKPKAELLLLSAWVLITGIIWVFSAMSAPTYDSAEVTGAAVEFAKNDFSALSEKYLTYYPFQLGYVFFNEVLLRIAGIFGEPKNLIFLEVLNVVFLAISYIAVILINEKITKDARVRHITAFLLALSVQPVLFCTFLYGIIPGFMFAVWALYFEVLFLENKKKRFAVLSAVFIAVSVTIKSNYIIVFIAMIAIALVKMIHLKQLLKGVIYCLVLSSLTLSLSPAVKTMYEKRSGIELGDSIPFISWISIGVSEAYPAPGWFNYGCTIGNFEKNNCDADAAGWESLKNVILHSRYMLLFPQYAGDFFYKKTTSQWNETSYQSIWTNQVRDQYAEQGELASWVCGSGEKLVKQYMDYFAQFIFAALFFGVLCCFKKKNFMSTAFLIIILGGFLYHLISEAKSQYSMPYFILMTGFAAYGICCAYDLFISRVPLSGRLKKFFKPEKKAGKGAL